MARRRATVTVESHNRDKEILQAWLDTNGPGIFRSDAPSSIVVVDGGDPEPKLTDEIVRLAYHHFMHDAEFRCSASAMREAIELAIERMSK